MKTNPRRSIAQKALGAKGRINQAIKLHLLKVQNVRFGSDVKVNGIPRVKCAAGSTIEIGHRVVLNSKWQSNDVTCENPVALLTLAEHAQITIGDDTGISGSVISARSSIAIGRRVLVGAGCLITDSDHHPTVLDDVSGRRYGDVEPAATRPIRIEDDVFIGARAIILKGVTIGRGAIVGAGAVVTRDVPERTVVGGNPARLLGTF